jgi:hypothetical protein
MTNDLNIDWGGYFYNSLAGGPYKQDMKNDVIFYDDANTADLGNMTVTIVTDAGYQCLRFAYGAALPAAVSGTSAADAMLLIPGQPYMYVRRIDGPNGYIYASPSNVAASNVAYLVGNAAGTYPATCATKFYGAPGIGASQFSAGVPRAISVPAASYGSIARKHYSNALLSGVHNALFPVSVNSWPTAIGAGNISVNDVTVTVSEFKV